MIYKTWHLFVQIISSLIKLQTIKHLYNTTKLLQIDEFITNIIKWLLEQVKVYQDQVCKNILFLVLNDLQYFVHGKLFYNNSFQNTGVFVFIFFLSCFFMRDVFHR